MKHTLYLTLGTLLSLSACGDTTSPPDATPFPPDWRDPNACTRQPCMPPAGCRYVPSTSRAAPAPCACGDLVCDDAGVDATVDRPDDVCVLSCAAPPPMCRYEGPVTCNPPSCGRLVCADASVIDMPRPPTDTPSISCGAGGSTSFPSFDNTCVSDGECIAVVHQTDCCGNMRALGIQRSQREAFNAAEAVCRPMYPRCGCPTRGIEADDMRFTFSEMNLAARCTGGRCVTSVTM
jgi:hypothetical protein